MNYTEKVKKTKEITSVLLSGTTEDECRKLLANENYPKWDIDKIIWSSLKAVRLKYGDQIRLQMLEGSLATHIDEYDELSAEMFERIQYEQIEVIQRESKKVLATRFQQGDNIEDIRKEVVNEFFSVEQFEELIQSYLEDKSERNRLRTIGIGSILAGTVLTLLSGGWVSNGMVVFYGLVIFGIWYLVKAYNLGHNSQY